jgi:hypothetical protein
VVPRTRPVTPAIAQPFTDLTSLRNVCEQLKEAVEVLQGQRGKDSLDMVVRWRDLVQLGLIQETDVPGVGNPHVTPLPDLNGDRSRR